MLKGTCIVLATRNDINLLLQQLRGLKLMPCAVAAHRLDADVGIVDAAELER